VDCNLVFHQRCEAVKLRYYTNLYIIIIIIIIIIIVFLIIIRTPGSIDPVG